MDYEKKYNEALNWMRELYPGLHGATKEDAEHYFPELIKNEDERMRKSIIDVIQRVGFISSEYKYEAIAWLEKQRECGEANFREGYLHGFEDAQKEQKPVPINSDDKYMLERIMALIEFCDDKEIIWSWLCEKTKAATQKPAEWSEEDKETIDLTIAILKENFPNDYFKTNPANTLNMGAIHTDELINRLKSLNPQAKEEQKEQKPEVKLKGWVARDKEYNSYFGLGLVLFNGKPRRSCNCWSGTIAAQLPWEIFPDIKWEDEPMEVEIIIRKK